MDWKSILADLKAAGYTQKAIAAYCGVAQTTISDLATGNTSDTLHATGESLKRLHKLSARKRRTKAEA